MGIIRKQDYKQFKEVGYPEVNEWLKKGWVTVDIKDSMNGIIYVIGLTKMEE